MATVFQPPAVSTEGLERLRNRWATTSNPGAKTIGVEGLSSGAPRDASSVSTPSPTPEPHHKVKPADDVADPVNTPYGPQHGHVDEAAGGADSSPFENEKQLPEVLSPRSNVFASAWTNFVHWPNSWSAGQNPDLCPTPAGVSPPPIRYACHLGVYTAPENTLIANAHGVDEIRSIVGADSLGYLSLPGLVKAISLPERQLCNACFHGRYPMAIDGATEKLSLEQARP